MNLDRDLIIFPEKIINYLFDRLRNRYLPNMKIAVCLYGYYNNSVDPKAGVNGYNYIEKNIVNKLPSGCVDFFVHSWDTKFKETILSKYRPIHNVIESQIDFNVIAKSANIDESDINESFDRNSTLFKNCTVHNSLSFLYSRSRSIELKSEYEFFNKFKYDSVVVCRFDLGQRSTWHLGYNVSLMEFNPTLDMNYIYSAMWKQLNAGYADQWFFSSSENIDKLGMMYKNTLNDYFQTNSNYYKVLTKGWPDSNSSDDFSNELFSNVKSIDLVKYPKWQMINNHILHKWHFLQVGLYDKSKFIGKFK